MSGASDSPNEAKQPEAAPATGPPAKPVALDSSRSPRALDRRFFVRLGLQAAVVLAAGIGVILFLALGQRLGWIGAGSTTSTEGDGNGQIYTCAMHPQIRQPKPGRCPICGMELVPAASQADRDEMAVNIDPAARRLANIQTASVERRAVYRTIDTVGRVAIDESRMATIAVYVEGRIERIFADYTGVEVAQQDHLAVLYSPQFYSAQVEYAESRRALAEMGPNTLVVVRNAQERLVANSRQRLVELGMTTEQLVELEQTGKSKSRLTIYAPIGGTVTEKLVVEGQYVKAGEPIYRIANLSTVWLMLELYPEDAALIRFGQKVQADVQSLPGEPFKGRVAFIDPTVDQKTRTVGVRVEFKNRKGRLRPGDFATAHIHVPLGATGDVYDADLAGKWISPMHPQVITDKPGPCPICGMDLVPTSRYGYSDQPVPRPTVLVVPRTAVLMAGENSVVYVETEPGRFEIRRVTLGPFGNVWSETEQPLGEVAVILDGVAEGEAVATSGNFLIDSQMQLSGRPSLLDPSRYKPQAKPNPQPLSDEPVEVQPLAGEPGRELEELFSAYFAIQSSLTKDRVPPTKDVERLRMAAQALQHAESLSPETQQSIETVLAKTEHLHHLELAPARETFKSTSHAVIRLASRVRGAEAERPFAHFFCPMVAGGGGDWLQGDRQLANPYFGSSMLECGKLVRELPVASENE